METPFTLIGIDVLTQPARLAVFCFTYTESAIIQNLLYNLNYILQYCIEMITFSIGYYNQLNVYKYQINFDRSCIPFGSYKHTGLRF